MKQLILLLVTGILLASCGSRDQSKQPGQSKPVTDSLMDQVMNGHDIGMTAMNKAGQTEKSIIHFMDSLGKIKGADPTAIQSLKNAQKDLDSASAHMDQWMQEFDMDMKGMDSLSKIGYLRKNLLLINSIDDNMNFSIQKADSLLKTIHL